MENNHEGGIPFSLEELDMENSQCPTREKASQVKMGIEEKIFY